MSKEMDCTYTRDVRKKRKVWMDGTAIISADERSIKLICVESKKVEFSGLVDSKNMPAILDGEEGMLCPSIIILLSDVHAERGFKPEAIISKLHQIVRPAISASSGPLSIIKRTSISKPAPSSSSVTSSSTSSSATLAKSTSADANLAVHYESTCRRVSIAPSFIDICHYCSMFINCVNEEISLSLSQATRGIEERTRRSLKITTDINPSTATGAASAVSKASRPTAEDILSKLRFAGLPFMIHVGFNVKVPMTQQQQQKSSTSSAASQWAASKKRRNCESDSDEEATDDKAGSTDDGPKSTEFHLMFSSKQKDCPKHCEGFGKDDIWALWIPESAVKDASEVVNPDIGLTLEKAKQLRSAYLKARYDHGYPLPFFGGITWQSVFLFRANWHYITPSGYLGVSFLTGQTNIPPALGRFPAGKSRGPLDCKYSAIRIASGEMTNLMVLDLLRLGIPLANDRIAPAAESLARFAQLQNCNAIRRMLKPPGAPCAADSRPFPTLPRAVVAALAHDVCLQFSLNADQTEVIHRVCTWFNENSEESAADARSNDIILVHGVFGSGKSHLLASICVLIAAINRKWIASGSSCSRREAIKCMLSANTNVAVDRIMRQLCTKEDEKEEGHEQLAKLALPAVARVGCVSKIDASLRRQLVFTQESAATAKRELEKELKSNGTTSHSPSEEQKVLSDLLSKTLKPAEFVASQRKLVASADVVGVTCASAGSAHLSAFNFPVLILDEASQMTEPLSMLAIAAAQPRFMLVVGDPQQLPPAIASTSMTLRADNAVASNQDSEKSNDLSRTLFDRLIQLRWRATMLRTQYRCHPTISGVCSRAFYGSRLLDGVTATERPAILDGLPPISAVNIISSEERRGDSFINEGEAGLIKELLQWIRCSSLPNQREISGTSCSIGIICMYKAQSTYLSSNILKDELSSSAKQGLLKVSTVDAFQGSEMDIIIVATSRNSNKGGFLASPERVNVAVSRAKSHLIIVGSLGMLHQTPLWGDVLTSAALKVGSMSQLAGTMYGSRVESAAPAPSQIDDTMNGTVARTPGPFSEGFLPMKRSSPLPQEDRELLDMMQYEKDAEHDLLSKPMPVAKDSFSWSNDDDDDDFYCLPQLAKENVKETQNLTALPLAPRIEHKKEQSMPLSMSISMPVPESQHASVSSTVLLPARPEQPSESHPRPSVPFKSRKRPMPAAMPKSAVTVPPKDPVGAENVHDADMDMELIRSRRRF